MGKYHPAECQQVIFEPPNSLLSFYNDRSAPSLLAVNSPCAPAATGAAAPTTLFVGDNSANRITTYDITAITNGENAQNVLGVGNFTTGGTAATSQSTFKPVGMAIDSTNNRLFVADNSNHRVLVFDISVITDGENAVNVLGQPDFTTATAATTQSGMNNPRGLAYDATNNRLFVADLINDRVTVFDVSAITNGENAVNVLGQADFTTATGATTQSGMDGPRHVAYDSVNQRLYVADGDTNLRVTVFDVTAITNGENATNVLCQPDFTSATAVTSQAGCSTAVGVALK